MPRRSTPLCAPTVRSEPPPAGTSAPASDGLVQLDTDRQSEHQVHDRHRRQRRPDRQGRRPGLPPASRSLSASATTSAQAVREAGRTASTKFKDMRKRYADGWEDYIDNLVEPAG